MKAGDGYLVAAKRCDECLYGPNKIVSNARRAEILRQLDREDGWFVCHKAKGVRCRGDYEQRPHAYCDRLALALGLQPTFISTARGGGDERRRHHGQLPRRQ